MKFYFCEMCGKRITDIDLAQQQAYDKKLRGVFCKECGVGVETQNDMPAITNAQIRQHQSGTRLPRGGIAAESAETAAPRPRSGAVALPAEQIRQHQSGARLPKPVAENASSESAKSRSGSRLRKPAAATVAAEPETSHGGEHRRAQRSSNSTLHPVTPREKARSPGKTKPAGSGNSLLWAIIAGGVVLLIAVALWLGNRAGTPAPAEQPRPKHEAR